MKAHIKRHAMPKTWNIKRKKIRFVVRPFPGGKFNFGIPLLVIFRDILKKAKNAKEVKSILLNNEIYVDGVRRKDPKFFVGLMDVISIPSTNEYFRMLINKKNELELLAITKDEANLLLCKIVNKSLVKGKCQLNLHNGRNILVDKTNDYKVGDSVLLNKNKIEKHIKLEKGSLVYLIGGKHIGMVATASDVKDNIWKCKIGTKLFDAIKDHLFVVGKEKPAISLLSY